MSRLRSSTNVYVRVYAALVALTLVTIGLAYIDLAALSVPAALTIATAKSTLVALWFMRLRDGGRSTSIVLTAGGLLLAALIVLSVADLRTRAGWG